MGSHPWEIVFGHPHGIHLYPTEEDAGWSYRLAVSTEALYAQVARMAIALDRAAIPFELHEGARVQRALAGQDEIEVGPRYPAVQWAALLEVRPDALPHIRWDPISKRAPVTPPQAERIRKAAERDPRS